MDLNADFSRRACVHAARLEWRASPMPGVERRMLDRVGDEVARATSIVRYAPRSHFAPHVHGGGEEFLVLDGVFQDEHGDYPAGTYVRNPPRSAHTPGSAPGCVIFVKLWQFDPADRTPVRLDTAAMPARDVSGRPGARAIELFHDAREEVRIEAWAPDARVTLEPDGGLEILVLDGAFADGEDSFAPQSWLRLPLHHALHAIAGPEGARVWIKTGHLRHAVHALSGSRRR